MNFNIGEVLTRAWQITWKYKVLWIFGILAGCSRGGSSFNGGSSNGGSGGGNGNGFDFNMPNLPPQIQSLVHQIQQNLIPIIAIAVTVCCLVFLLTIFLGTVGRIGLIHGTQLADGGAERLGFGQLFSESTPYFWRIFGLSLLIGIPIFLLIAIPVGIFVVYMVQQGSQVNSAAIVSFFVVFFGCLCLFIPFSIVLNLVIRQAESAIVLENLSVFEGLRRGWDVFKKNLGPMILIAIILFFIAGVAGFIAALPLLITIVSAVFAFIAGQAKDYTALLVSGLCIIGYLPISLVANGIITTYSESAWTLTYLRLTAPKENTPVQLPDA